MLARSFMVVVLAVGSVLANAQDDRLDELDFDEAPIRDEAVPYFAVGVGFGATVSWLPMDDVNVRAQESELGAMSTPMILWGGEVFAAIGVIPNVRLGFSWMGGLNTQSTDVPVGDQSMKRTMEYLASHSTFHAEYAIAIAKGLAIVPGTGIGFSNQIISTYQSANSRTWDDYRSISTFPDMFSELSRSSFTVPVRLSIEYAVTPFVALRGQAAYTLQVAADDWMGNRTATVTGVPDGINLSAFSAQLGLFVGLFN